MAPSGRLLYAGTNHGTNFRIDAISTRTGEVERSIPVPGGVEELATSPDGQTDYVSTQGGFTLTAVNLTSGAVGPPIQVPRGGHALAVTPNGRTAYAAGNSSEGIGRNSYTFVTPIDLVTGVEEPPIPLRHGPTSIALTPSGGTALVTGGRAGPPAPPAVSFIDLATQKVAWSIRFRGAATAIAVPAGR